MTDFHNLLSISSGQLQKVVTILISLMMKISESTYHISAKHASLLQLASKKLLFQLEL